MFFLICLFRVFLTPYTSIDFNTFYANLHPIFFFNSIESESNLIQFEINFKNSIQFRLHAISFNIFIQMELDFHEINSFFHLLIITNSAQQCKAQVRLSIYLSFNSTLA
jgi:hypothetical protein